MFRIINTINNEMIETDKICAIMLEFIKRKWKENNSDHCNFIIEKIRPHVTMFYYACTVEGLIKTLKLRK